MGQKRIASIPVATRVPDGEFMGGKIVNCTVESISKEAEVWHRRGLDGVEVHVNDIVIRLPKELLETLAGEELSIRHIRQIEDAEPRDLFLSQINPTESMK